MKNASIQDVPFIEIFNDANNHGSPKLFPLIVQYFDVKKRNHYKTPGNGKQDI